VNTYFIRGLECKAYLGPHNWQKSVLQQLLINIEWQTEKNDHSHHYELLIKSIIELSTTQHWDHLEKLAEQIKQLLQNTLNNCQFQFTIDIPHAYSQTESVGIKMSS